MALESVSLSLSESTVIGITAELREVNCENAGFIKFLRSDNLDMLMNLPKGAFAITSSRCWGQAPDRTAKKFGEVAKDMLMRVLSQSGLLQISLGLQLLEEEKSLKLAVHIVEGKDTEQARDQIKEVPHAGAVHLKNNRILVRCLKYALGPIRKLLSPSDPRYAVLPDLQITRRWVVHGVPAHVAPLRLSEASMTSRWAVRRSQRRTR